MQSADQRLAKTSWNLVFPRGVYRVRAGSYNRREFPWYLELGTSGVGLGLSAQRSLWFQRNRRIGRRPLLHEGNPLAGRLEPDGQG